MSEKSKTPAELRAMAQRARALAHDVPDDVMSPAGDRSRAGGAGDVPPDGRVRRQFNTFYLGAPDQALVWQIAERYIELIR